MHNARAAVPFIGTLIIGTSIKGPSYMDKRTRVLCLYTRLIFYSSETIYREIRCRLRCVLYYYAARRGKYIIRRLVKHNMIQHYTLVGIHLSNRPCSARPVGKTAPNLRYELPVHKLYCIYTQDGNPLISY